VRSLGAQWLDVGIEAVGEGGYARKEGADPGDRGSGAGLIDEVLAGGDERGDGEAVDAAGFTAAGVVDQGDGVVGEQRVGSAAQDCRTWPTTARRRPMCSTSARR
jgi:hypothetical protein